MFRGQFPRLAFIHIPWSTARKKSYKEIKCVQYAYRHYLTMILSGELCLFLYLLTKSICIARWHFGCLVHIMAYRHVRTCIIAMSRRHLLYLLRSFCAFVRRFPRLHYFSAFRRETAHSKIKYDQIMDECNLNLHLQKSFKKILQKSEQNFHNLKNGFSCRNLTLGGYQIFSEYFGENFKNFLKIKKRKSLSNS